jgi:CRISPR-associated exonuclease Cas4
MVIYILVGLVFLLAIILISKSRGIDKEIKRLKIEHKIQDGKITYSDLNTPAKALFSKRYRLSGKPDYIVKNNDKYIPVELKTGYHVEPQKHHVLQLAAYCQLVEDSYNGFTPHGLLIYNDTSKQFKIPFDPGLRFELESTIEKMRYLLKTKEIKRNHSDPYKCKNCSMKTYCDTKII